MGYYPDDGNDCQSPEVFFYHRENVRLHLELHAVRQFSYRAFSEYIVSCYEMFTDEFVTFIGPFWILGANISFAESTQGKERASDKKKKKKKGQQKPMSLKKF